jgi:Arc/MetJ family transcription regulator
MSRRIVIGYSAAVRKTSVTVDEELIARASAVLGTRSLRETIQRSLEEVVAQDLRQRHIERLKRGEFDDLSDPAVMAEAWR